MLYNSFKGCIRNKVGVSKIEIIYDIMTHFAILEIDESEIRSTPYRSRSFNLWHDRAITSTVLSVMLQKLRLRYLIFGHERATMHISSRFFILYIKFKIL